MSPNPPGCIPPCFAGGACTPAALSAARSVRSVQGRGRPARDEATRAVARRERTIASVNSAYRRLIEFALRPFKVMVTIQSFSVKHGCCHVIPHMQASTLSV